jgi:cardiolipin synthase
MLDFSDRVRAVLQAWWAWLIPAVFLELLGWRIAALVPGAMAFVLYHSSPGSHPAVYALEPDFDTESSEFTTTMAGVTGMPVVDGNRVDIYNNGDEFYPAMLEAIESARLSVTMEQYIFWHGEVGRRFAEAFAEKARAGVSVKLLLDAIGSATLGSDIFKILEAGGCQTRVVSSHSLVHPPSRKSTESPQISDRRWRRRLYRRIRTCGSLARGC